MRDNRTHLIEHDRKDCITIRSIIHPQLTLTNLNTTISEYV